MTNGTAARRSAAAISCFQPRPRHIAFVSLLVNPLQRYRNSCARWLSWSVSNICSSSKYARARVGWQKNKPSFQYGFRIVIRRAFRKCCIQLRRVCSIEFDNDLASPVQLRRGCHRNFIVVTIMSCRHHQATTRILIVFLAHRSTRSSFHVRNHATEVALRRSRLRVSGLVGSNKRSNNPYLVARPRASKGGYLSLSRYTIIFSGRILVARARCLSRIVMQSSVARGRARQVSHIFHLAPSLTRSSLRELSRCSTLVKFQTKPSLFSSSHDARRAIRVQRLIRRLTTNNYRIGSERWQDDI